MDAQPRTLPNPEPTVGSIQSVSLRHETNETTPNFLQLETGPRGGGSGRAGSRLESLERICTPPVVPDRPNTSESDSSESISDSHCTSLASPTMVLHTVVPTHRSPPTPPNRTTHSMPLPELQVAHGRELPATGRMDGLREQLSAKGIPGEAAELIIHSWRTKTNTNYNSAWKKWAHWCHGRGENPFSAPISSCLGFLAHQFSLGREYRSLNLPSHQHTYQWRASQ